MNSFVALNLGLCFASLLTAPARADENEPVKEMVLEVKAVRRRAVKNASTAISSTQVSQERITTLPQGDQISLPKLLATTTPGVVAGPFGQTFVRGNHANVQYQIDGVQLPDSASGTFGEAFSPRNIDHMDVITGGLPAEYGERMAAAVNIYSKSGAETPGGSLELNYGTNNRFSPQVIYGGSTPSGDLHYFASANYFRTNRGLDTPQPKSGSDQTQGGPDNVHDNANGNSEFAKLDWVATNDDKLSLVLSDSRSFYQIPNYPSSFTGAEPIFTPGGIDAYGNPTPLPSFTPPGTNDTQLENNDYLQAVWKHTFSPRSFLQSAPYWKYSYVRVGNDPVNDLAGAPYDGADSFSEHRHVNNFGLKEDYTLRADDKNLFKTGLQLQFARAAGDIFIQIPSVAGQASTFSDSNPTTGYTEAVYAQDDYAISKSLTLNAGLRFTATQFNFAGLSPTESLIQPRVGLSYLVTESTKVHGYYGRLFQPAPAENLRDAFQTVGGIATNGQPLQPYDIKAEKDHYFEVGVEQNLPARQALTVNTYYKKATDMLDDTQLLNTSIASPFNFATGYVYGAEVSVAGDITDELSEYVNYSFEVAKGKGISGGVFAFPAGQIPDPNAYYYLDHCQVHTVNSGITYKKDRYWGTAQGFYGSGLRSGPNNTVSLPGHFTMDLGVGYEFKNENGWGKFKLAANILNLFDNRYPINISNGYNGSHYNGGREYMIRLVKEL